jgi:hypothetical protein
VSSKKLADHLQVDRYGDFVLTEAIRPSIDLQVVPREGYRRDTYRDRKAGLTIPVLAASVTREKLFEVFLALLDPLGEEVDVVLETSHDSANARHRDLQRDHIDRPILESYLCEFEELLLNDGCTGVAVIGSNGPMEVQFDEHKLLIVYAHDLVPFERILKEHDIPRDDRLKLITEGEHLHTTDPRYVSAFEQLRHRLGIGQFAEHVNWE